MECEIEALKARLTALETRLAGVDYASHARTVKVMFDGPGEPIEIFALGENPASLTRAVEQI